MRVDSAATWMIALLGGLVWLGLAAFHAASQVLDKNEAASAATVRVVQTRDDGVLLELTAPPPTVTVTGRAGRPVTTLTLPGTLIDATPGAPRLPVTGALLAIPPRAAVTLHIVEATTTTALLPAPLLFNAAEQLPAPAVAATDDGAAPLVLAEPTLVGDAPLTPDAYSVAPGPVTIAGIEAWRSQRMVRLLFRPVQLGADGARLTIYRRVVVALNFTGDSAIPSAADAAQSDEGSFEPLLQATLLNYAQARAWRQRPTTAALRANAQAEHQWRVHVGASGMVRIDCALLAAANAPVDVTPPTHWQVRRNGKTGPVVATGVLDDNGDSRCDAGESLIFYADVQATQYAADAIFWLSAAPAPGVAIAEITPPPATASEERYRHYDRYERNRLYYSYIPLAEDAEHWYWDILTPAISVTRTYTFTVSETAAEDAAQVSVALAGYDGAHITQVAVNEHNAASSTWEGRRNQTITANIPITWLQAGVNTLSISALGAAPDLQYVDAFTVTYSRRLTAQADRLFWAAAPGRRLTLEGFSTADVTVYNLANLDQPRRVTATVATPCPCRVTFDTPTDGEATYLALTAAGYLTPTAITAAPATDLRNPTAGADYLMLTPAGLAAALEPLVTQRRAAGLRVRMIDVQAIYDEFGDGRPDPTAIQRFLNHTLSGWPAPAPAYVLLVGDGSYDPRGYQTSPPVHMLPAYLRFVDPVMGETACDNCYVTATANSQAPQMMIGRLPARTPDEVAAMIAKLLAFEAAGADAAWRRQAVIVADNAYQSDGRPDAAGNFWALADRAAALLAAADEVVERLYFNPCAAATVPACDLPDPPYRRFADASTLTAAFQFSVRNGRGLVIYTGHASPISWAGAPTLLRAGDALTLGNGETPFVALEMSCYTGFFHGPYDTLAEALLRAADGGAVATWSSSGQSPLRGQDVLLEQFLTTALANPAAGMTLGQAVLAAKLHLYGAGGGAYASALDTFHLLGDPALVWREAAPPATPTPTPPMTMTPTTTPSTTVTPLPSPTNTPATAASSTPVSPAAPSPTATLLLTATLSPGGTPWQAATPTPTAPAPQLFLPMVQAARAEGEE